MKLAHLNCTVKVLYLSSMTNSLKNCIVWRKAAILKSMLDTRF